MDEEKTTVEGMEAGGEADPFDEAWDDENWDDGEEAEAESDAQDGEAETPDPEEASPEEAAETQETPGERPLGQPDATLSAVVGGRTVAVDAGAAQAVASALGISPQALLDAAGRGAQGDPVQTRMSALLDEFARSVNMSLPEYLDALEQQRDKQQVEVEMQRVAAQMPEDTPEEALRALAERNLADQKREDEARRQQEAQAHTVREIEAKREPWRKLLAVHPEIQGVQDMPREVYEIIKQTGGTPLEAFTAYERDKAQARVQELERQLAAANTNSRNREASPGSMTGAGADEVDAFLLEFESDD